MQCHQKPSCRRLIVTGVSGGVHCALAESEIEWNRIASATGRGSSPSPELKSQVVVACQRPGASVAGIALTHGINANIVHRRLREHARGTLTVNADNYGVMGRMYR